MEDYKKQFIELALQYDVLRFGEFTLKSGRVSPYFFNAGLFNSGQALAALGGSYAVAMIEKKLDCDVLFGPAYKGIPLVSSLAIALSAYYNINKPYSFNRKEAKSHGEGGSIVGAELTGDVLIDDDVITAGTAIRDAIEIIKTNGGKPSGVLIALDRQEKGQGELSAIQEVQKEFGIDVYSIITLGDLVEYLANVDSENLDAMKEYRVRYGIEQ